MAYSALAILLTQFPASFSQKKKKKKTVFLFSSLSPSFSLSVCILHSLPRFLFVAKKKLLLPNKKENLHKVNTHTHTDT